MVQRRAAWWTLSDYTRTNSVTSLQSQLNCQTLEGRRSVARLCLSYNFVNGLVAVLRICSPHIWSQGIALLWHFAKFILARTTINTPSFHRQLSSRMPSKPMLQLPKVFSSLRQFWPFIFTQIHYNSFIFYNPEAPCLPKKSCGCRQYHKIDRHSSEWVNVEKWTNIHDWDQNIISPFCRQHAYPFGLKVYTTSTQSHRSRHKCVRHLCQNKCLRDQNWHVECPFDFHQQIMVMSDSQGELVTTITQILVRMVIWAVKYIVFINVYTTSLLIILVSSASIFVGEW